MQVDNVQEGSWQPGRVLLRVLLRDAPRQDERVDLDAPYQLVRPLKLQGAP